MIITVLQRINELHEVQGSTQFLNYMVIFDMYNTNNFKNAFTINTSNIGTGHYSI